MKKRLTMQKIQTRKKTKRSRRQEREEERTQGGRAA
jgi:hypothetical protein